LRCGGCAGVRRGPRSTDSYACPGWRPRNGKYADSVESLRRWLALQDEENLPIARRAGMALAYMAMAEAKLGRRAEAQAALDAHRAQREKLLAVSKTAPSEEKLLVEAETVFRQAFGAPPAAAQALTPAPES
jgi:hypothetical protein